MQCRCLHLIIVMLNFAAAAAAYTMVYHQTETGWCSPSTIYHPQAVTQQPQSDPSAINSHSPALRHTLYYWWGARCFGFEFMYIQVVSIMKMSMLTTNIITRESHVNAHSWHIYHGLKIFAIGSSEANKIPRLNFRPIVNLGIYFQVSCSRASPN